MKDQKILALVIILAAYSLYSVHKWFTKEPIVLEAEISAPVTNEQAEIQLPEAAETTNNTDNQNINKIKPPVKRIPLYFRNACSILDIFTIRPVKFRREVPKAMESDTNSLAAVGITIFLFVLAVNAVLDVIKAKEEERVRQKQNSNGERRQSLAEFANKKTLRRESSKFGFQLFQISESTPSGDKEEDKEKKSRRPNRPYVRGESINSYLSEKATSQPSTSTENSGEPKLVKRQSVAKLFGTKTPMVRRSSFPAMPLNPDLQALMLGHRQPSTDSDDESDGKGRRVRIIRRF